MMEIVLSPGSIDSYRLFIKIKTLPRYRIIGRTAVFPDEYASRLGIELPRPTDIAYTPSSFLFDYQSAISRTAIEKRKFAIFADCGLGKTPCLLEFGNHARRAIGHRRALIVSPLMVIRQTIAEARKFYGSDFSIEQVAAADLPDWTAGRNGTPGAIGITNYEAITDAVTQGILGCLILDESSLLKSMYGKWGTRLIDLGRGLDWKLCLTGTPAPNDRIEYANHAVFLDAFPTVNSFLAKYFVNRGQSDNRWEIKPYALKPFYKALSHWCIFLTNPATYGWKDNTTSIPPIRVHIEDVDLTDEQLSLGRRHTGTFFAHDVGGITSRAKLSRIAKGTHEGREIATNKYEYIKNLVESWPDESTIIWCIYNDEQERIAAMLPEAANITGSTPIVERERLIEDFQAGRRKVLVSKGKILGFGLNMQIATRQVFSGLVDSYETFYQCVKRSNRYGATRPLNVHIPISDLERPMIETVLKKAARVQADTEAQEELFKDASG